MLLIISFPMSLLLGNQNLVMALVANKSDLDAKREVETEVSTRSSPPISLECDDCFMKSHVYIKFGKSKCALICSSGSFLSNVPHIFQL